MTDAFDAARAAAIFKTYDVRGVAPDELSPELAYRVGRALVVELGADSVAVGRDMRVTGDLLSAR
jgi:phosphomannomutase